MNQIKQEVCDSSGDCQDYQWTNNVVYNQTPQLSQYFNPDVPTTPEEESSQHSLNSTSPLTPKEPKKRGRPKKVKEEGVENDSKSGDKKSKGDGETPVGKKKRDRFNGMSEIEVMQRHLPDHITNNLDILIVGINPGLFAAYVGHHYAGPGNHFWKCLHLSGLIPEPMTAYDDYKLLEHGIGFTNIVARATKGSADLKKQEIKDGANILREKLALYKPKIAVFNGKGIYEVFCGNKNFPIGKQPDVLEDTPTILFVMPSSSARCAQLPRAVDKVPYYMALKKLRDYLKGDLPALEDSEVVFPNIEPKPKVEIKEESFEVEEEDDSLHSGAGDAGSSKELTLEQIQNQTEYLEALMASAEGKDIPGDNWLSRKMKSNDDRYRPAGMHSSLSTSLTNDSFFTGFKPACSGQTIKKEIVDVSDNEYGIISVAKPIAHKVETLDYDPSAIPKVEYYDANSAPQYLNLGDIPTKKKRQSKQNIPTYKSSRFPYVSTWQPQSGPIHPSQHQPAHPGFPFMSQALHRGNPLGSSGGGPYMSQAHSPYFTGCKDVKPGHFLNT